jgi:hypothetical protein
MEQRQLAWLITTRSQVRVLVPQPRKKSDDVYAYRTFFLVYTGKKMQKISLTSSILSLALTLLLNIIF